MGGFFSKLRHRQHRHQSDQTSSETSSSSASDQSDDNSAARFGGTKVRHGDRICLAKASKTVEEHGSLVLRVPGDEEPPKGVEETILAMARLSEDHLDHQTQVLRIIKEDAEAAKAPAVAATLDRQAGQIQDLLARIQKLT